MFIGLKKATLFLNACTSGTDQLFTNDQLLDLAEKQLDDLLITMQIDELELVAALSSLDDNIKSGPDCIPPYVIK